MSPGARSLEPQVGASHPDVLGQDVHFHQIREAGACTTSFSSFFSHSLPPLLPCPMLRPLFYFSSTNSDCEPCSSAAREEKEKLEGWTERTFSRPALEGLPESGEQRRSRDTCTDLIVPAGGGGPVGVSRNQSPTPSEAGTGMSLGGGGRGVQQSSPFGTSGVGLRISNNFPGAGGCGSRATP